MVQLEYLDEVTDNPPVVSNYLWREVFFVFFRDFNDYPRRKNLDSGRVRRETFRKTDSDLDGRSLLWHFLESVVPSRSWHDRWLGKGL